MAVTKVIAPKFTIGMDPSSKRLAIFVLRDGRAIHSEWRPLPDDKAEMLHKAMLYTQMLCKRWGMKAAAAGAELDFFIEEPVVGVGGPYPTIIQSKIHGAAVAGAVASGWTNSITGVQNTSWKKAILGRGNFPKTQIENWMKTHWKVAHKMCSVPDEFDAACIAQYGYGLSIERYDPPEKTRRRRKTTKLPQNHKNK